MQIRANPDEPPQQHSSIPPLGWNPTGLPYQVAPLSAIPPAPVNFPLGYPHIGTKPPMSAFPSVFDGRPPVYFYYPPPVPIPQFFPYPVLPYPQMPYQYPIVPQVPQYPPQTSNSLRINESFQKTESQPIKPDNCDSESTQQPTPSSRKSSVKDLSPDQSQRSTKIVEPKNPDVSNHHVIGKRSEPPSHSQSTAQQIQEEEIQPFEDSLESQIRKIRNFWKGSNYSYPHILKRVKVVRHKLTDEVEVCEVLDFSGKGLYTNNHCEEKFFAAI